MVNATGYEELIARNFTGAVYKVSDSYLGATSQGVGYFGFLILVVVNIVLYIKTREITWNAIVSILFSVWFMTDYIPVNARAYVVATDIILIAVVLYYAFKGRKQ